MRCLLYIVFTFEVILFIFIFILGFCYILCAKLSQSNTYITEQKIYLTSIYSWKFQSVNTQDFKLTLPGQRHYMFEQQKHSGLETDTFLPIHTFRTGTHSGLGSHFNIVQRNTPSVAKNHKCRFILPSLILF